MKSAVLAPSCAVLLFAAAPASAQSLTDAINQALAPIPNPAANNFDEPNFLDCAALGAGVGRFNDVYQFEALPLSIPNTVDITNGEAATTATVAAPVVVPDGTGRDFTVRRSTSIILDPAVANAMTEEELYAFLVQTGVQNVTIKRFAAGNFGAGLAGTCQSVIARVNQNGNVSGSSGFAGGSSSASGRSVSSLSSAREQSSKQKKRKKKKSGRDSSYEDGYVRLASADGGVGLVADAAGVGPFGVQTFIDLRAGYTDIDRDATALEGGFDGHAIFGQGSVTAEFSPNFALAGSFAYQRSVGEFDTPKSTGLPNEFSESNYTGSAFLIASWPIGAAATFDLAAGGFYGGGDGEVERTFMTTRQVAYLITVTDPVMTVDLIALSRSQSVSDDLLGEYDTRNYGFSAAASVSFPMGGFVVTPGVEFTHFTFKQDDYDESVTDAFNNGLALSYSEFKDKWTETRIGGAVSRDFGPFRLEGYGDLVLVGGAATPVRTATFVEDLRANPYVLSYQVDALDRTFGVFGLVAAAGIADRVEAFIGAETNVGHDYLTTRTIFAGVRLGL